jgi:hypothetical protein
VVSTETEKRGAEFKKKLENYLDKHDIPRISERHRI